MLHLKNNLSRDERGFRYVVRTADSEATPYIEWNTERIEQTAAEVLAEAEEETPRERAVSAKDREAVEWLRKGLAHGPAEAASIYRRAESAGIGERPLKRATRMLGVLKEPKGFRGAWHWGFRQSRAVLSTLYPPQICPTLSESCPSPQAPATRGRSNEQPARPQCQTDSDTFRRGTEWCKVSDSGRDD
jgi:hypothetical protein